MGVTLEQVAELAGVSPATVSRVLNDQPNVTKSTRKEVLKAIEQSGYKPHAVARSLAKNETGIIGLVIPKSVSRIFSDPYFALFIGAITEECHKLGLELMLSLLSSPSQEEELYSDIVSHGFLDGLLFASNTVDDPLVEELLRDNTPFISVGRHKNEKVNFVDVNNYEGAKKATQYLLNLGHECIATITGPLDQAASIDRLNGYKDSLKENDLSVQDELIFEGDFTEESGREGVQKLLAEFPTAIFAASDHSAIGVIKKLKKMGRKIPEDVAVIGFDDIPSSSKIEPGLTTISQPIEPLGKLAVRKLVNVIENQSIDGNCVERSVCEVLDTELIVRDST